VLRSVSEAIPAIVGADGLYRFVNSTFERWIGMSRDQIIGRGIRDVLGQAEHERSLPWIEQAMAGKPVNFEREYAGRKSTRHLAVSYFPLQTDDGSPDGFVSVAQDITTHRQEALRLLRLSQRDALTGLLNRAGFEAEVEHQVSANGGAALALLYIDLDRFKQVNDQHGHAVGDQVLQVFSQRLQGLVRLTDTVARLGGDEFTVVLSGLRKPAHANAVADKILAAAHAPFELGTLLVRIGASVGVALGAGAGEDWRTLLARGDAMLYRAKQAGRGRRMGESG